MADAFSAVLGKFNTGSSSPIKYPATSSVGSNDQITPFTGNNNPTSGGSGIEGAQGDD